MLPFKLTQSQKRKIQTAKSVGAKRVELKLTASQRELDETFVADVQDLVRAEVIADLSPSSLACQLREAREKAGMSLADVAKVTGMTRQAILAIECGKNANPKIDTIQRIAKAFGLAVRLELVNL
jgi:DNA-binding XRE family transcriptional regulator